MPESYQSKTVATNWGEGMRVLSIFTMLFMLLVSVSASAEIRDPGEHFFESTFGDYSEELEIAKEEGKRGIFLFFEEEDCPFCARMKATILNRSAVQDFYRQHFKLYRINIKGEVEVTDFAGEVMLEKVFAEKRNKVRATPLMAFYNLEGQMVVRYTGAASSIKEFLMLGQYALDEEYLNHSFSRYKRQQRKSR